MLRNEDVLSSREIKTEETDRSLGKLDTYKPVIICPLILHSNNTDCVTSPAMTLRSLHFIHEFYLCIIIKTINYFPKYFSQTQTQPAPLPPKKITKFNISN